MIHSEQADPFIAHVRETCGPNGRYRTPWLAGIHSRQIAPLPAEMVRARRVALPQLHDGTYAAWPR